MTNSITNNFKNRIRTNIKPVFLSTLGTYDNKNRIYARTLPFAENVKCRSTCKTVFDNESKNKDTTNKNTKICRNWCDKFSMQYIDSSDVLYVAKKVCGTDNSSDTGKFIKENLKCIEKNKSNILKQVSVICGNDEVCEINNQDIYQLMIDGNLNTDKDVDIKNLKNIVPTTVSSVSSRSLNRYHISNHTNIYLICFIVLGIGIIAYILYYLFHR